MENQDHRLVPAQRLLDNRSVDGLPEPEGDQVDRVRTYVPPKATLPWERQPGEPAHAYRAFMAYRDLGDERSIGKATQAQHLSKSTAHRWSVQWRWLDRVQAWDQEVDRRQTRGKLKAVERMGERHASIALQMQSLATNAMRRMPPDGSSLSNKDIVAWLKESVRIERRARGVSDTPSLNFNITQQQAALTQSTAMTPEPQLLAQRTMADLVRDDPSMLGIVNAAVEGLIEAAEEYSSRNESAEVVPG